MSEIERIKSEKDGLDVYPDLERYAQLGYAAIPPDDLARMRWYGLYEQKPKAGHFMLRVKIPGGQLSSAQMRMLAAIAEEEARGFADITTRQDFQFHWITVERIPEVLRRLRDVGLTTVGACGDVARNVTGCPAAGIDPGEVFDVREHVQTVTSFFLGNREFSNLPRKFKISISACPRGCVMPQINDVGAVAVRRKRLARDDELGFRVWVGGGLSSRPMFAQPLRMFVPADRLVDVCRAVAEIFRDHGNRQSRLRARLKFLVAEWGIDRLEDEVRRRLSWTPDLLDEDETPCEPSADHVGVHRQRQDGLCYVGVPVLSGRLEAEQMLDVSRLAEELAAGRIRTTAQQNLLIPDVPQAAADALLARLERIGLSVGRTGFRALSAACTGNQFCNLAITETKKLLADVIEHLEASVQVGAQIRIGMSGCPNGCAQHLISDIGLQGCLVTVDGSKTEGYDVLLGGSVALRRFARPIVRKVPAGRLASALERLLKAYLIQRSPSERFTEFCASRTDEQLAEMLLGAPA